MTDSLLSIIIQAQDKASRVLANVDKSMSNLNTQAKRLGAQGFDRLKNAGQAMVSALAVGIPLLGGALMGVAIKAGQAQAQIQTMSTALETSFGGNVELAKQAQKEITAFATKTPFQLNEVMTAFVKLKNMGLDPSNEALTAYGDTASAMGKTLNDMIEAVADASTGEFERLKEFGIRASSQGDKVSFTFKGVTTTVGKNSKEIEQYLINLGKVNFAGGMEKQSQNLAGLWSTLTDSISLKLAELFDKLGGTKLATELFVQATQLIDSINVDQIFNEISMSIDVTKTKINELTTFYNEHKTIIDNVAIVLGSLVTSYYLVTGAIAIWTAYTQFATAVQIAYNAAFVASPIGWVIIGIGLLIAAIVWLILNWQTVTKVWNDGWKWITDTSSKALAIVKNEMENTFNSVKNFANGLWTSVQNAFKSGVNNTIAPLNRLIDAYNKVNDVASLPDIPRIPAFASGTKFFAGGQALVGENGPEIVSLPRGSQVDTATSTKYNMQEKQPINLNIGSFLGSPRDLRKLKELLESV